MQDLSRAVPAGAKLFAITEGGGAGVNWENINDGDYSILTSFQFMLLDTAWYLIFAAYLEAVAPSQYGSPKHPLFFLSFLRTPCQRLLAHCGVKDPWAVNEVALLPTSEGRSADEEPVSDLMGEPAVRVANLIKNYHPPSVISQALSAVWNGGRTSKAEASSVRAVDGLNLELWSGQVTCLLGHNGAGKSTTISMLTGLTPPTSGDALVFGKSLTKDLAGVRNGLGVCPQTNVIFPALTVEEHLYYFARVKVS